MGLNTHKTTSSNKEAGRVLSDIEQQLTGFSLIFSRLPDKRLEDVPSTGLRATGAPRAVLMHTNFPTWQVIKSLLRVFGKESLEVFTEA